MQGLPKNYHAEIVKKAQESKTCCSTPGSAFGDPFADDLPPFVDDFECSGGGVIVRCHVHV